MGCAGSRGSAASRANTPSPTNAPANETGQPDTSGGGGDKVPFEGELIREPRRASTKVRRRSPEPGDLAIAKQALKVSAVATAVLPTEIPTGLPRGSSTATDTHVRSELQSPAPVVAKAEVGRSALQSPAPVAPQQAQVFVFPDVPAAPVTAVTPAPPPFTEMGMAVEPLSPVWAANVQAAAAAARRAPVPAGERPTATDAVGHQAAAAAFLRDGDLDGALAEYRAGLAACRATATKGGTEGGAATSTLVWTMSPAVPRTVVYGALFFVPMSVAW